MLYEGQQVCITLPYLLVLNPSMFRSGCCRSRLLTAVAEGIEASLAEII